MTERDPEPRWLTTRMVLAIHADQVTQHGGSTRIRDEGGLRSVLARARNRRSCEPPADLADLAAAYGHGSVTNRPFLDGNKRIAFQAMYVFLGLNGLRILAEEAEVVAVMVDLASDRLDEAGLARWLNARTKPR